MAEAETEFLTPFGSILLKLHSDDGSGTLRAWDAADEYLIKYLADLGMQDAAGLAIFNDKRGALSVPLSFLPLTLYVDSFTSRQGVLKNLELNECTYDTAIFRDGTAPRHSVSHILIKIPDSLDLLEHQLLFIRGFAGAGVTIIAGGMTRHIHTSTIACFERILGSTTTSLARKKARLIFCTFDSEKSGLPDEDEVFYRVDGIPAPLINMPGVFSRHRQDPGTRFFLEHLKLRESFRQIADFGCGNGLIGIHAALQLPEVLVTMIDDSAAAVISAKENIRRNGLEKRVTAVHGMSLEGCNTASLDCILSNPPFHQGRATSLDTAFGLIDDAHKKLNTGGELQLVANAHLGYHTRMERVFGNVEFVADNRRYVILRSIKK